MLFVHKLRLFYFPPSTVSSQTVEAIYHCAEMLTQTFKSDLFLNIFHYIALQTSLSVL